MKNKKVNIAITIGVLCVFGMLFSSSYAYWQITKTQKTPNDIVAACLDITMQNESGTFGLDNAWPISDSEGEKLTGYTFEVVNHCNESVNYVIGLNSVETSTQDYLDYSNLKLKIDDKENMIISNYAEIEYSDIINSEELRDSKLISMESLEANGRKTHNIKVWIDEYAPVDEQNKSFRGQVFITGGQGVPVYNPCFTMANNGTILSYDESCGLEVTVPESINGVDVKQINFLSFSQAEVIELNGQNLETKQSVGFLYYKDQTNREAIENYFKTKKCPDNIDTCNLDDYYTTINNYNEYLTYNWDNYKIYSPSHYKYDAENNTLVRSAFKITSLDLSGAKKLESINERAFYQSPGTLTNVVFPQNGMLTNIGTYSFASNRSLKNVDFPNTLKIIGEAAFMSTGLQNVYIPASVEVIADYALSQNNTRNIEFEDTATNPSQLKTIGKYALQRNDFGTVVLPSSLKLIDDFAFMTSYIEELFIPASVERIGTYTFKDNQTISKVTFEDTLEKPSQLKIIDNRAFEYNNLTIVNLPSNLETIASGAFGSNKIKVGVIPASVINLESSIFYSNKTLEKIIVKRENFDGVNVNSAWNAISYASATGYTYAPYEFDPDYNEES